MLFRQLFDRVSCTYTYLLAANPGAEALIIDPVLDNVDRYLQLFDELNLHLVMAIDTHVHADHITGLGALRDRCRCITVMGKRSKVDVVSMRIDEGDPIEIDGVALSALYTPGHTDDSYCFVTADRVFTGDTLLIRGTGRTDFQSGDPYAAYESLFGKLLTLPDNMRVYPGHDYKGDTVSTIGEERAHNPRLQVASAEDYAAIMNGLHLPDPKMMDVAVPANLSIGMPQTSPEIAAFSLDPLEARARLGSPTVLFVDLREDGERRRDGIIPGSVHVPYPRLEDAFRARTPFSVLAPPTGGSVIFYCAFGERSALALEEALGLGLDNVWHLSGGFDAWLKEGAPSEAVSD